MRRAAATESDRQRIVMRTATRNSRKGKLSGRVVVDARSVTTDGEPARRWNLAAFEEALARCESKAYHLAIQLVSSEFAAREIVQEPLSAAWQEMHRLSSRSGIERQRYRSSSMDSFVAFACAADADA
jgi:hypothetical protein